MKWAPFIIVIVCNAILAGYIFYALDSLDGPLIPTIPSIYTEMWLSFGAAVIANGVYFSLLVRASHTSVGLVLPVMVFLFSVVCLLAAVFTFPRAYDNAALYRPFPGGGFSGYRVHSVTEVGPHCRALSQSPNNALQRTGIGGRVGSEFKP